MNETANSRPIMAKKSANGNSVNTAIKIPWPNNLYKNPDKIANKLWPAVILANNRIPNENALAKYEINSIVTNNGTNANGVPVGTKYAAKCTLWIDKPRIVTPTNIVNDNPIETIIDVPNVNE